MGFTSFAGRVLFAAVFILSAWQKVSDFGTDGGQALKQFQPKYQLFRHHVASTLQFEIPHVPLKYILLAATFMEGVGGILFVFGSTMGVYLLMIFLVAMTPIMHDFYNYDLSNPAYVREFVEFLKNLALFGALTFYLDMKMNTLRRKKTIKSKSS